MLIWHLKESWFLHNHYLQKHIRLFMLCSLHLLHEILILVDFRASFFIWALRFLEESFLTIDLPDCLLWSCNMPRHLFCKDVMSILYWLLFHIFTIAFFSVCCKTMVWVLNDISTTIQQVPSGEILTFGDNAFIQYEDAGVKEARKAAFILVAGGLGERLGYNGIKVGTITCMVR